MKFAVKVIPNAKNNEIVNDAHGLRVKIKAPANDGKANRELIKYLAEQFNVSSRNIEIIFGLTSRLKLIRIYGLDTKKKSE
ncbi:MAG: YggU family protein, partial [Acidobacteria bacterium]